MKSSTMNKDTLYSLYNADNYKIELTETINEVIQKYSYLLLEYYKFITENIKYKNRRLSQFIITRGIDTVTNVFLNILLYTKNIDLTYFHGQKSFYFYVEFVMQITEDEKTFLQLSTRDATTYVYKKTIYEIHNELKKINSNISDESKGKFEAINVYVNINKILFSRIIDNHISKDNELMDKLEETIHKLNNQTINLHILKVFEKVVINLNIKVDDANLFFDLMRQMAKKIGKNNEIIYNIEKQIYSDDFTIKLKEQPDKLINWLII